MCTGGEKGPFIWMNHLFVLLPGQSLPLCGRGMASLNRNRRKGLPELHPGGALIQVRWAPGRGHKMSRDTGELGPWELD